MLTGGCLCGAIRYRYQGTLGAAFNCHCSICRRSAGAPFLAWQTLNSADLTFDKGAPKYRYSTEQGRQNETPPRVDLYARDRLDWVARDGSLGHFDEMPPDWPL